MNDRPFAEISDLLFMESPLPLLLWDAQSRYYLHVNKAALQLYGYTIEEWRSMTVMNLRPPEEQARLEAWLESRNHDPSLSFQYTGT